MREVLKDPPTVLQVSLTEVNTSRYFKGQLSNFQISKGAPPKLQCTNLELEVSYPSLPHLPSWRYSFLNLFFSLVLLYFVRPTQPFVESYLDSTDLNPMEKWKEVAPHLPVTPIRRIPNCLVQLFNLINSVKVMIRENLVQQELEYLLELKLDKA